MSHAASLLGLLTASAGCGLLSVDVTDPGAAQVGLADAGVGLVLPSTAGDVALADVLARGPAVLVFYRGHW